MRIYITRTSYNRTLLFLCYSHQCVGMFEIGAFGFIEEHATRIVVYCDLEDIMQRVSIPKRRDWFVRRSESLSDVLFDDDVCSKVLP
jgi:hypothetical protein